MEACMETTASPSPVPASLWALRIAGPRHAGRRLAECLRGVPKPALRAIFGKSLGNRIWQQARSGNAPAVTPSPDRVADTEIAAGMLTYVSQQAADALLQSGRQAAILSVTLSYADGQAQQSRRRLAHPTSQCDEIARAAIAMLHELPSRDATPASIRLAMTSVASNPWSAN
jgi:nucleotidyltransferase/DNA polymerase involved in DNA repair